MRIDNSGLAFHAGMTQKMKNEIKSCDVKKIQWDVWNRGIQCDFKQNKVVAWCSQKVVELIEEINKRYGLDLGLPKGIIVEDFKELDLSIDNYDIVHGCINLMPCKFYKKKDIIVSNGTIFFNEHVNKNYSGGNEFWDKLDENADKFYAEKGTATDFFLELILHEFAHAMHEKNLQTKLSPKKLNKFWNWQCSLKTQMKFKHKYGEIMSKISNYAKIDHSEAVACDISKRLIENIDKETLKPTSNFFENSPYNISLIRQYFSGHPNKEMNIMLKKTWDGKR